MKNKINFILKHVKDGAEEIINKEINSSKHIYSIILIVLF